MTEFNLKELRKTNDLQLWSNFKFSEPAIKIRNGSHDPKLILEKFLANNLFIDTIQFLALIMSKLEAIWWAAQCCEKVVQESDQASLTIQSEVKNWLHNPDDDLRVKLEVMARKHELALPICWVAMAIFWHNGSITPKDTPEVLADDAMTLKAVSAAVQLAAVYHDPVRSQLYQQQFIQLGLNIMGGVVQLELWQKNNGG